MGQLLMLLISFSIFFIYHNVDSNKNMIVPTHVRTMLIVMPKNLEWQIV